MNNSSISFNGSIRPKKFGYWTITRAISSDGNSFNASMIRHPILKGISTYSTLVLLHRFSEPLAIRDGRLEKQQFFYDFVCPALNIAASANAVPPSYIDELAISMPVSSQIIVWNSKIACSSP